MKKPTPAQLAARARFAEMARSGAFKRKAKAAKKAKAAPKKATSAATYSVVSRDGAIEAKGLTLAAARKFIADKHKRTKRHASYWSAVKTNPRKRNPVIPSASYDYPLINDVKLFAVNDEMLYRQQGRPIVENLARKMVKGQFDADKAVKLYGYLADSAVKKYSVDYVGSRVPTLTILSKPERQVLAQHLFEFYADEIKYAADEMAESKRKRNPATGRKGSGTKLNPVVYRDRAKELRSDSKVAYAVHMPDRPSYHAIAYFSKKADAMEVAQETSDRIGKPLAVSRVQIYFGQE